ncbi:MAG: sugar phosphate isomerase/epimerase [Flammeovirgaceae bacterium]|nr:sugar phosphate isomerase/epimerase [Flammeovirgaceae bacterium]
MINRRKFLLSSGALALGGLAISQQSTGNVLSNKVAAARPVGLQLYTVTNAIEADLDGTLKRIAEIGYKDLETAFSRKGGYYGLKPKEFAAKAKEYGLNWRAHHIGGAGFKMPAGAAPRLDANGKPIDMPTVLNLRDNFQEAVDHAAEGGLKYLVCSSTPINTMEEINLSIETFNKTGEACKKAGIGFAYHNHTKEFDRIDGKLPYEMFLSQISADIMKMELDLAWVTKSGTDPLELFKKNPGRFPLWHVKDLDRVTQRPVEVGAGYVDLKRVFEASEISGLQYLFVEQDGAPDPLTNIATSYANIQKLF